jgi:hypothetical protein
MGRRTRAVPERMGDVPDEDSGGRQGVLRDDGRHPSERNIRPLGLCTTPLLILLLIPSRALM